MLFEHIQEKEMMICPNHCMIFMNPRERWPKAFHSRLCKNRYSLIMTISRSMFYCRWRWFVRIESSEKLLNLIRYSGRWNVRPWMKLLWKWLADWSLLIPLSHSVRAPVSRLRSMPGKSWTINPPMGVAGPDAIVHTSRINWNDCQSRCFCVLAEFRSLIRP